MKYTSNYNLKKPDGSDAVRVDDFNENADAIDTELASRVKKVADKGLSANDYTNAEKAEVAKVKNKAEKLTVDNHIADTTAIKHKAREIQLVDNKFTSTNVEAGMGELFTNVSNGKDLVSGAITGVDDSVVIPTEPSFADLAGAIGGISTGRKWASGDIMTSGDYVIVSGLSFKPSIAIVSGGGINKQSHYSIGVSSTNGFALSVAQGDAYRKDADWWPREDGFRIELYNKDVTDYKWVAFE